jgi:hypothetical protein
MGSVTPLAFHPDTTKESQRKIALVLACVLLIACLSSYYQARNNPPGFYLDESSIAYNAYTISQHGQDEHGEAWPLYFRAFGEYKNPVYIYLLALLFRIFGPGILVARLLSVSLGIAAVLTLSLLAFQISKRFIIATIVGLSAALTPWLFENSRLVFEVAIYPLLVYLFLLALFRASQQEHWGWLQSISIATTLAVLTYSYSIGRLLAPLLAIGLIFFATRKRLTAIVMTWLLYGLMLTPGLAFYFRHPGALTSRFWLLTYVTNESSIKQILFNFLRQYAANINPWTIAITGEINVRDHVGTMGAVLAPTLLFSLIGILVVLVYLRSDRWWRFMLYALVVSVVPASLTTTHFPQIRLIAMPIFLHVFLIPALLWLTSPDGKRIQRRTERLKQAVLVAFVLTIIVQGTIFRVQFKQAGPDRGFVFDEQFPREVLPTALSQNNKRIYLHDPLGKSGYIQAYWHGTLQGISPTTFVRVGEDQGLENGSVVISTAEECSECRLVLKSVNYIVYIVDHGNLSQGPKR